MTPEQYQQVLSSIIVLTTKVDLIMSWLAALTGALTVLGGGAVATLLFRKNGKNNA